MEMLERTLMPHTGSSPLRMAGKPASAASVTMMPASPMTMSTPACAAVSRLRILQVPAIPLLSQSPDTKSCKVSIIP